jgi:hypothetical protein
MKNKLAIFIMLLVSSTITNAQIDSTIISEGTSTIKVDAISHETMNVSGSVSVAIQISALDTAYIDSLWFGETSIFSLSWSGTFSQSNLLIFV